MLLRCEVSCSDRGTRDVRTLPTRASASNPTRGSTMFRRVCRAACLGMLAAGGLLMLPAGALAASVQIGSTFAAEGGFPPPTTYVVVSTASTSPKYVVPAGGTRISAFWMRGSGTTAKVKLKVMRKTSTSGTWKVIGQSAAVTLAPTSWISSPRPSPSGPATCSGLQTSRRPEQRRSSGRVLDRGCSGRGPGRFRGWLVLHAAERLAGRVPAQPIGHRPAAAGHQGR